jgi:hypothetical protein
MVLTKVDGHDYHVTWSYPVPVGGSTSQFLKKNSSSDFDMSWAYPVPVGGTTGQVLTKSSSSDFAMSWTTVATLGYVSSPPPSPSGASGQYLATVDGSHTNMEWVTPTLHLLGDVNVTEGAGIDGLFLKWDNGTSKWIAASGGAGGSLSALSDVTITSAQQYDLLEFDGSKWVNKNRGEVDLGTTSGSHAIDPTTGSVFKITPNGAVTITNPGTAIPGQRCVLKVLTSGTTSYQVSFPSGFSVSGDLFTGVVNNCVYTIDFVMDFSGTLCEVGRSKPIPQVVALGTTGTVSLDPTVGHEVFTITPSGAVTLNAASAPVGKRATLVVTTSGTSSFNITPTTNFKSTGALATGTVSGKVFTISFIGDGTNMNEVSRTAAM